MNSPAHDTNTATASCGPSDAGDTPRHSDDDEAPLMREPFIMARPVVIDSPPSSGPPTPASSMVGTPKAVAGGSPVPSDRATPVRHLPSRSESTASPLKSLPRSPQDVELQRMLPRSATDILLDVPDHAVCLPRRRHAVRIPTPPPPRGAHIGPGHTRPHRPPPPRNADTALSLPWNLRRPGQAGFLANCAFITTLYFWRKVEFSLRVALLAVVPCSTLLLSDATTDFFVDTNFAALVAFFIAAQRVGAAVLGSLWIVYSILLMFVLCIPVTLLGPERHWVAWTAAQSVTLFIAGMVSEGLTRKITLMLITMVFTAMYNDPDRATRWDYSLYLGRDMVIGIGFGLFATVFPLPHMAATDAERLVRDCLDTTSVCFVGLCHCFWAPSNLQRSVSLMRIRSARASLDGLQARLRSQLELADFEPFTAGRRRRVRQLHGHVVRLESMLDALIHAVRRLRDRPEIIDDSAAQASYAQLMPASVSRLAAAVDTALHTLGHRVAAGGDAAELEAAMAEDSAALTAAVEAVEGAFAEARHLALQEARAAAPPVDEDGGLLVAPGVLRTEEADTVMALFLLNITQAAAATASLDITVAGAVAAEVEAEGGGCCGVTRWALRSVLDAAVGFLQPIPASAMRLLRLARYRGAEDVQRAKEALKVTVSIMMTFGIFYLVDDKVTGTGPNIIAFMSASNSGEAMHGSMQRLIGALFGAVFAIFAGSLSSTLLDYLIGIGCVIAIMAFISTGDAYAVAASYGGFAFVPMMAPGRTLNDAMRSTRENVLGGIVYFIIGNVVWQLSPTTMLREQRDATLRALRASVCGLFEVFGRGAEGVSAPTSPVAVTPQQPALEMTTGVGAAAGGSIEPGLVLAGIPTDCGPGAAGGGLPGVLRVVSRASADAMNEARASLIKERGLLPLAQLEPTMREAKFPLKAAESFLQGQRAIMSTIDTMLLVWDVLLGSGDDERRAEVDRVLQPLGPLALELAAEVAEAFNLLTITLRESTVNVGPVLVDRVLRVGEVAQQMRTTHLRQVEAYQAAQQRAQPFSFRGSPTTSGAYLDPHFGAPAPSSSNGPPSGPGEPSLDGSPIQARRLRRQHRSMDSLDHADHDGPASPPPGGMQGGMQGVMRRRRSLDSLGGDPFGSPLYSAPPSHSGGLGHLNIDAFGFGGVRDALSVRDAFALHTLPLVFTLFADELWRLLLYLDDLYHYEVLIATT